MRKNRIYPGVIPFRTTAIATALFMLAGLAGADPLVANNTTQSADGDYATTSTGTAGYTLWASNNGVINSDGAATLSILSTSSSAIVAQSGGQITLGGGALGRFDVVTTASGSPAVLIAGTVSSSSLVSLTGADIKADLGDVNAATYGASLTGYSTLNLTDSTITVSAKSATTGSNTIRALQSTGANNHITLNNVSLSAMGATSARYGENVNAIYLAAGATLTGDGVTAYASSASDTNGKAVLDAESGSQVDLSNIQFTGSGAVIGGAYSIGTNTSVTLRTGSILVSGGFAGVYNVNSTSTLNAYDIDATFSSRGSGSAASVLYSSVLNQTRGSLSVTSGSSASVLYVYRATANLLDTALTLKYGATSSGGGYLISVYSNGYVDANHITATAEGGTVNGASTGIYTTSGGRVKLYNGSELNVTGYNMINTGTPSYGALITGTDSSLIVEDSVINVVAPRAAVVGVQAQTGGAVTLNNATVTTSGAALGSHALVNVDASSSITATNSTIKTSGATSYGALAKGGSLITLNSSTLSTSGDNSAGVNAIGGSTIDLNDGSISTQGSQGFGIYLAENGNTRNRVTADGTSIDTTGYFAVGVSNHYGNTVELTSVTIDTTGTDAYGLDNSGASLAVSGGIPQMTANNVTITTHGSGAHGVVNSDGGELTMTDSQVSALGTGSALVSGALYGHLQPGIDTSAANTIDITSSALDSASAAAISMLGGDTTLMLTDSTVTGQGGVVLDTQAYAGNAAKLALTADNSTLTGAITTADDGSTVNVTLQNNSQWNVGGNSTLTHLTLDTVTVRLDAAATLDTDITLNSGGAVFDTNGFNASYHGTMDGSGSLVKNGLGTFTLNGVNALGYTGDTTINAGVLALRGLSSTDAASINKTIILNGGWLDLSDTTWTGNDSDANNWTNLHLISGGNAASGGVIGHDDNVSYNIAAGTTEQVDYQVGKTNGDNNGLYLVKSGDGTLVLNHANEYKGYTRIDGGVLQISADNQLGDTAIAREVILNGGDLQITADLSSQRVLEIRQSGSLTVDSGVTANWNGGILESDGSYDFTKTGDGTLVLGGAASQTGATIVNAGTLQAGAENLFTSNDRMQIDVAATVDLQGYRQQINHLSGSGLLSLGSATAMLNNQRDTTFDGLIDGSGDLIKVGGATLALGAMNRYTGDTLIAEGTVKASVNDVMTNSRSLTVDGVFDVNNTIQHVNQLSGSGEVHLGSGRLYANNASGAGTLFSGVIDGSGQLSKTGGGMLVLSGENIYTGGTTVSGGTLQIGNGGTSGSVQGNILNNAELGFNRSDDISYDGVISGSGSVYKAGDGALTLNSVHTYTDTTHVIEGTLIVGDDQHVGARLSSGLVNVDAGATFGGYGSVAGHVNNQGTLAVADALAAFNGGSSGTFTIGGNLTNSGRVYLASEQPASRLVVNGDYIGNDGLLELSTVLGDDSSATDKLVVLGSTSGNTSVIVNGIGTEGAQTVNGIPVIEVGGASNGVFTLSNRVVAGPYEYSLLKGLPDGSGGNWYLRSEQPGGETPEWRPEVGAYLSNQYLAGVMQVHTLFDRQGAQYGNSSGNVWGRVVSGRTSGSAIDEQISQDSDYSLLHIGGDGGLFGRDDLRLGIMGSWGQARSHASAQGNDNKATGDLDGYNLGIYATWYADGNNRRGAYVDSWAQYGWYNNQVKGDQLRQENYDSHAFSVSLETGYSFILSGDEQRSLRLTPQAQVVYSRYEANGYTEQNGTVIDRQNGDTVQTRLGVRLSGDGLYNGRLVQPYVEGNWWYADKDQSIAFSGIDIAQGVPRSRWELKAGLQGQISKRWMGWVHAGIQQGGSDFRQFEGMAGVSYRW